MMMMVMAMMMMVMVMVTAMMMLVVTMMIVMMMTMVIAFLFQSTCLSILHNILDFDNDREYSTALNNIPLDPLLSLLQASDADSGACDMRPPDSPPPPPPGRGDRQRRRKRSSCSQSSFDDKPREMSPVPGVGQQSSSVQRHNSGASDGRSHNRSSVCSVAGSAEEHAVPFYWYGVSFLVDDV